MVGYCRPILAFQRCPAATGNPARLKDQACPSSSTIAGVQPLHVSGPCCSRSSSRSRDRNEELYRWSEIDSVWPKPLIERTKQKKWFIVKEDSLISVGIFSDFHFAHA